MEWTAPEVARLRELKAEGKTVKQIAETINRSENSVEKKWKALQKNGSFEAEQTPVTPCNRSYPRVTLRGCVFDLECMEFTTGGWTGHMICTAILPLDANEPACYKIRFEDNRDDRRVLAQVIEELSKFDLIIGHNINAFDCTWLYSRAMYHGMPIMRSWLRYDTYQSAKTMAIKVESKSLGALGSYFQLHGVKTRVFKTDWSMIDSPNRAEFESAMADISYHCAEDVKLNRDLFDVLWHYDPVKRLSKTKW